MRNDVFDCLLEDIDPNSTICELLRKLRDEDLQGSSDYNMFVNVENSCQQWRGIRLPQSYFNHITTSRPCYSPSGRRVWSQTR